MPVLDRFAGLASFAAWLVLVMGATAAYAAPPTGEASATTLSLDEGAVTISWYYYNLGDYNQDGLITINDITPLGQHYGEQSPDLPDPFEPTTVGSVIDGNGDGLINISDITQIGQNWGNQVSGYNIYISDNPDNYPDDGWLVHTLDFSAAQNEPSAGRRLFQYQFTLPPYQQFIWVRPTDGTTDGIASNSVEMPAPLPLESGQIEIRLPSDACGAGGTLAVRIFAPEAGAEYFPEGAPVMVFAPGGTGSWSVENNATPGLEGIIEISFSAPGSGVPPTDSDGLYDGRGQNCVDALGDVLRYALGLIPDSDGWMLQERTAANVLYDNVGIMAASNGGPLTMATLAQYGDGFGVLAWYVGWENPTCSQTVMPDAGPGENVIGPFIGHLGFVNPEYNAWGPAVLDIDYATIAYDPFPLDPEVEMLYLNRGGMAHFDTVPLGPEALTSDLNHDNDIGVGEDWGFRFWEWEGKRYYSLAAIEAVWDHTVFTPGSEPAWLPTVAEAETFWLVRDAANHYDALAAKLPGLRALLVGSVTDHVQSAPDRPHIHQAFDGFNRNGLWVKLNPSPESLIALEPALEGRSDLPDNEPNVEPGNWQADLCYVPDDVEMMLSLYAAGVREMVELVQGE